MEQHPHEATLEHADQHQHHGGNGKYLAVFGALCVLTAMSFFIGNSSIKETAPLTAWAAMMAVSVGKALLVMLFFMHLLWEANWKYVLTIPAAMMSVFLILMLVPDIGRRVGHYSYDRWVHSAEGEPVIVPDKILEPEHHDPPESSEQAAASQQAR
jgi:cytochrome c oxidase subunit 4